MSDRNIPDDLVPCGFCGRSFSSDRALKIHCGRMHAVEMEAAKAGFVSAEVLHEDEGDLAALAEDCERDMYGDDYEHLRDSGWLDR